MDEEPPPPPPPLLPESPVDQAMLFLKTRPYVRRDCRCPNCRERAKHPGAVPTGRRLHNCDYPGCSKVYDDASRLAVHISRHTGVPEYSCDWPGCGKRYFRRDHMKAHMQSHTGEDLMCKICDYKATGKYALMKHAIHVHGRKTECTCPNCQADGPNKLVGPNGRKLHTCHHEGCGRGFDAVSRLQIHLQRHSGQRNYVCKWDKCNKSFFRKDHLKAHMQVHTGDKIYVCDICDYRFLDKNSLVFHIKNHKKPPVCEDASPAPPSQPTPTPTPPQPSRVQPGPPPAECKVPDYDPPLPKLYTPSEYVYHLYQQQKQYLEYLRQLKANDELDLKRLPYLDPYSWPVDLKSSYSNDLQVDQRYDKLDYNRSAYLDPYSRPEDLNSSYSKGFQVDPLYDKQSAYLDSYSWPGDFNSNYSYSKDFKFGDLPDIPRESTGQLGHDFYYHQHKQRCLDYQTALQIRQQLEEQKKLQPQYLQYYYSSW